MSTTFSFQPLRRTAQYAEFLNKGAATDIYNLYSRATGDPSDAEEGGITGSGSPGSYR